MKKVILIVAVVIVAIIAVNKCSGTHSKGTTVMGYMGTVEDVEDGNTLVLTSGLRVWLLGVEENHTSAEMWLKNNVVGQDVTLVSDSRNEQAFNVVGATVKAYATMMIEGLEVCINRLCVADCPDAATLAYMADSNFTPRGNLPADIHDKALYMKQRTMLVSTASGIGTGFFISPDGVAVTNNHVLSGNESASVNLYTEDAEDSKIYSSRQRTIKRIIWTNKALDITIFKVALEDGEKSPYFNLVKQHEQVGHDCHLLGNPQGLMASYAKGVISAYREDENVSGKMLVQYDVATNGGNSGGPVMNNKGEIIAVHEMGMKSQTNGAAAQGLNFGIDILIVRQVLDSDPACADIRYGGK